MGVPIAEQRRTAGAGGLMCGDQREWIELKAGARGGRDIGDRWGGGDMFALPQEQPASLIRGGGGRGGENRGVGGRR